MTRKSPRISGKHEVLTGVETEERQDGKRAVATKRQAPGSGGSPMAVLRLLTVEVVVENCWMRFSMIVTIFPLRLLRVWFLHIFKLTLILLLNKFLTMQAAIDSHASGHQKESFCRSEKKFLWRNFSVALSSH